MAAKRPARVEPPRSTVSPAARDCLMKILDEAPQATRALPVDGFAETQQSSDANDTVVGRSPHCRAKLSKESRRASQSR